MRPLVLYVGRYEETISLIEKAMRLNPRYPALYLVFLGAGYHATGRSEEAITACKKALALNPDSWPAHLIPAITYIELGREEEARAEAAEVLRLNPNFSVDVWKQRTPVKDPAVLEQWIAALRKAGLK